MVITDYVYPAIIGAIGAVVTNIVYFEYRFYKEKRLDFLKMQIDELLLPLYVKMQDIENEKNYYDIINDFRSYVTLTVGDVDIKKIAIEKLNLAGPKLSELLLDFMKYRYLEFDSSIKIDTDAALKNFEDLQDEVINQYEQKVKEYQYVNPWWKFWK